MSELFRGRVGKVIAGAVVVLIVVVIVGRGGGPSGRTVDRAADAASAGLAGNRAAAEGASAEVLLRSASAAMETIFAERQTFEGAIGVLPQIEPNVAWVGGPAADASRNQVALTVAGALTYTLTTTTPAGTTYVYARDASGVATRTCGPGCSW